MLEHMEDRITSQIFIVIARIGTRSAADKTLKECKTASVYVTGCNGTVYSLPYAGQFSILVDLLHAVFLQVWRREIQNKNGANSKTTEYAANIQKADLEEALQARYLMCSVQFPAVALQL